MQPRGGGARAREARVRQPGRLDQGSHRAAHDRGGRARRAPAARRHDRRADLGQHGRRPGPGRGAARLPLHLRDAGQDVAREDRAAARVRRRGRRLPDRGRARGSALVLLRLAAPDGGDPGRLQPQPVRQPGQPAGALRDHGPGDLGAGRRRARRARRRRRHGRHGHGDRPLPQGAQARTSRSSAPIRSARSTRASRCTPTSSRASARISGRRRSIATWSTAGSASPTARPSPPRAGSRARRAS